MGLVASCLTSICCSCATSCISSINIGTRGSLIGYFAFLFLWTIVEFVLLFFGGPLVIHLQITDLSICSSDACYGWGALVRISFAMVIFFTLHLCAPKTIAHLKWIIKSILFLLIAVGAWFIPDSFYVVYTEICRPFSAFFLIVQCLIIVDFAYEWNESWVEKEYYKAIIGVAAFFYACSITLTCIGFVYFASTTECAANISFLVINFVFAIVYSLISISSWIEIGGGILPSATVTLYCHYLVISSLLSDNSSCNTMFPAGDARSSTGNLTMTIINMIITALSVIYAAYTFATNGKIFGQKGAEEVNDEDTDDESKDAEQSSTYQSMDDSREKSSVSRSSSPKPTETISTRSYVYFFLVLICTSMYTCMLLTNWGNQDSVTEKTDYSSRLSKENYWIKIASSWAIALLYTWTLIAPVILTDRDFS